MKRVLTILIVLFLCGCSSQYSLNIEKNQISEKFIFSVDKSKIHNQEMGPYLDFYSSESIDSLINNDIYVELDNTKYVYEKKIVEEETLINFELNYLYRDSELSNSRFINECFENKKIKVDDDKISIYLFGKYNCLLNDDDSIEFKIFTKNKVESSSIKYDALTNEFNWIIDKNNANNVDIELTVLTETKIHYYGIRIAVISAIIIALGVLVYFIYKLSKYEEVNEI